MRAFNNVEKTKTKFVKHIDSDVVYELGKLVGVIYESVVDGKKQHYIHEFKKIGSPVLAVNTIGNQLYILGGKYKVTIRGIEG